MAAAYKFEVRRHRLTAEKEAEVGEETVSVSIMADLQEQQDKESEAILVELQEKVKNLLIIPLIFLDDWLIDGMIHWSLEWLIDRWNDWLIDGMIDW